MKQHKPLRKIDSHIFDECDNLIANLEFYEVFNKLDEQQRQKLK